MKEYPTDDELGMVRSWQFKEPGSFVAFMDYVQSIGNYWPQQSFGWRRRGRTYWISTGGWSGNEDILEAMQGNFIFWTSSWVSTRRGGHYIFQIPNEKTYFKDTP